MRPYNRFTRGIAAGAIALVLAACGSSSATPTAAPQTAPPATSAVQGESAAPTEAASLAIPSIALPTSLVLPSVIPATDLEARLPSEINGVALQKFSQKGLGQAGAASADVNAVLAGLGKTADDVSFAIAFDPTGKADVTFIAYSINGLDAGQFLNLIVAAMTKNSTTDKATQATVGGKNVTVVTGTDNNLYFLSSGGILYAVATKDPKLADTAVAALH